MCKYHFYEGKYYPAEKLRIRCQNHAIVYVISKGRKRICHHLPTPSNRNFDRGDVREVLNGQSTRDFIYKMTISQKECDETRYWLELLRAMEFVSRTQYEILHAEATELLKMIRSIVLTTNQCK